MEKKVLGWEQQQQTSKQMENNMRDVRSCAYNPLCVSKLWVHSSVCVSFKKPESMCPCVLFTVDVLQCGEDVVCVEFIFHWELLVQIRAAEIINERERVQQGEERPRKGYIEGKRAQGEEGMERTSASWELFLISRAESQALSPENTHSGPFFSSALHHLPPNHLFSFLSFSLLHILYSKQLSSVHPLLYIFYFPISYSRSNLTF